jgi:hypothetical protein
MDKAQGTPGGVESLPYNYSCLFSIAVVAVLSKPNHREHREKYNYQLGKSPNRTSPLCSLKLLVLFASL